MRPLELLLSLVNGVAFLALSIPPLRALSWARCAAPLALLVAAIQLLAEGLRWQMFPAYGLGVLLMVVWLLDTALPGGVHVHPAFAIATTALGAIVLIVAVALPAILPVFRFPKPTGPYAIGTVTYHWVDQSRPEIFTADPADHRELMVQVWYPAVDDPAAPRAPYIQGIDRLAPEMARVTRFPPFLFTHFKYVTTHAAEGAPVAGEQPAYPVLVYLSGLGGLREVSTFQIEELVSHGYIVAGIDQPGASSAVLFPDGRLIPGLTRDQLNPLLEQSGTPQNPTAELLGNPMPEGIAPYLAQDASFALDQLAALNQTDPAHRLDGRLDLAHVGVFGISMGAINAAELCAKDTRLKACLMMDAFVPRDALGGNLRQPSLWITRPPDTMRLERERSGGWTEADIAETIGTSRAAFEALPGDGYYVDMPTMFHINFTDAPYWVPFGTQLGLTGTIDAQRGFDIVNAYSVAFFDKHLKGIQSPLLEEPSPYPEAHIDIRRP